MNEKEALISKSVCNPVTVSTGNGQGLLLPDLNLILAQVSQPSTYA